MRYWLYSDGNILGPYEPADLLSAPDFTEESLVCDEDSINSGHDDWKPATQVPELSGYLDNVSAPADQKEDKADAPKEQEAAAESNQDSPAESENPLPANEGIEEKLPEENKSDSIVTESEYKSSESDTPDNGESFEDIADQDFIASDDIANDINKEIETSFHNAVSSDDEEPVDDIYNGEFPDLFGSDEHRGTDSLEAYRKQLSDEINTPADEIQTSDSDEDNSGYKPDPWRISGSNVSDLEKLLNSKDFSFDSESLQKDQSPESTLQDDSLTEPSPVKDSFSDIYASFGKDSDLSSDKTDSSSSLPFDLKQELDSLSSDSSSQYPADSEKPISIYDETHEDVPLSKPDSDSSMGDFLTSLEGIIPDEKKDSLISGDNNLPETDSGFSTGMSKGQEKSENKSDEDVKEELDSIRLEKDLLLGELSLNDLNHNDRKKRIGNLIQSLRTNAHKKGGKSVFDDDPAIQREAARQSLSVKTPGGVQDFSAGPDLAEGLMGETSFQKENPDDSGEAIRTEIDDSDAVSIKTSQEHLENEGSEGSYDDSEDSQSRPPIYLYETKYSSEPERKESVTTVSLADDFRSGMIDFEPDEEDRNLNLLPQQAGGIYYDLTALSGKPASRKPGKRETQAIYEPINVQITYGDKQPLNLRSRIQQVAAQRDSVQEKEKTVSDSEHTEKKENIQKTQGKQEKEKASANMKRSSISSVSQSEKKTSDNPNNSAGPAIKASKLTKSARKSKPEISEHELRRQSDSDGPIMEEISDSKRELLAKQEQEVHHANLDVASFEDEDRLKQETYEAILAGTDSSLFGGQSADATEDSDVSLMWDQSFDSGNLLQAASIENIGKDNPTDTIADFSDPFKAADIYSTPQQNVMADEIPTDDYLNTAQTDESSFLDIKPVDQTADNSQDIGDEFSGYYVDSIPGEVSAGTDTEEMPAIEQQQDFGTDYEMPVETEQQPVQEEYEAPVPDETQYEEQPPAEEEQPQEQKKAPKIINGIPASLSSIHRSIRTTNRKNPGAPDISSISESDLEQMPDFNVQLSSFDSDRVTPDQMQVSKDESSSMTEIAIPGLSDKKEEPAEEPAKPEPEKEEPPALDPVRQPDPEPEEEPEALQLKPVGGNSSTALPEFELNTSSVNKKSFSKPEEEPAAIPAVKYINPNENQEVFRTVSVPVEHTQSSPSSMPGMRTGTLSTVLNQNSRGSSRQTDYEGSAYQKPNNSGSRKIVVMFLGLLCIVIFGVFALFIMSKGGSTNGNGGTQVASASKDETFGNNGENPANVAVETQQPEETQQQQPEELQQPPVSEANQEQEAVQQQIPAIAEQQPEQTEPAAEPEDANIPTEEEDVPATASDKMAKAMQIVKGYKLSGGRGTIANWFSNSFLSSTPSTGDEWSATPLHANIYVVQYRLPRSRQDPLIYQFEVDIAKSSLLRGINNNAIDLLETGYSSKTARAVPARNTYDSDLPQKSASAKKKASNSGSLLQRAKQKFAPKKKYRKVPEIKQLPLPPAPKKRYSQAVPTGFEQPDEDSNEAFLKAMESDEELF